jgi:CcmD family protein
MSDWPWVIAAYSLTWVLLGIYTLRIGRRLARARAEWNREAILPGAEASGRTGSERRTDATSNEAEA